MWALIEKWSVTSLNSQTQLYKYYSQSSSSIKYTKQLYMLLTEYTVTLPKKKGSLNHLKPFFPDSNLIKIMMLLF